LAANRNGGMLRLTASRHDDDDDDGIVTKGKLKRNKNHKS